MSEAVFWSIVIPLEGVAMIAFYLKIEQLDNGSDSIWERHLRPSLKR